MLTIVLILFQHFAILRLLDYDVTVLLVLLPVWLLYSFRISRKFRLNSLLWWAFFAVYPFVNVFTVYSPMEYLKTYLQFLLCISVFLLIYNAKPLITGQKLLKALVVTQWILAGFLIFQYIMVVKLNQEYIFNPWGPFSWKYPLPHDEYNFNRMKGFFLEPSYVAFVAFSLYVCRYILEGSIVIGNIVLTVLSLAMINSSFGFLAFFLITTLILLFTYKGKKRILFISFIGLATLALLPIIVNDLMAATKLSNLNNEEYTSAYTRWIFPINLVIYIFTHGYYTGYGMGQLDPIISNFDLIIMESGETGVSNSLASLTIYFGVAIVPILFFLYRKFWKGNVRVKIVIIYMLICLSNTGAFNTIEFFFTFCILPYLCLKLHKHDIEPDYSVVQ